MDLKEWIEILEWKLEVEQKRLSQTLLNIDVLTDHLENAYSRRDE